MNEKALPENQSDFLLCTGNDGKVNVGVFVEDDDRLKQWKIFGRDYFDIASINNNQIRTLTNLRDTLLPKLMNGKVRIKV